MGIRLNTFHLSLIAALVWAVPAQAQAQAQTQAQARAGEVERGLLLLAHGGPGGHAGHGGAPGPWNRNVLDLAESLDRDLPTEVAFGMANPESIQAGLDRLQKRGVSDVAVVPLFVSPHSPIIGNFRYILGLQDHLAPTTSLTHLERVDVDGRVRFSGAMGDHRLIGEILLGRARAVAEDPARTDVVIIAHGPNTDQENRLWLRDMDSLAEIMREAGFRSVEVLTHRNDAPAEIKAKARARFRAKVDQAGRDGAAVVVPLLLSAGGIEHAVEADLTGLDYRFAEPLMPHPNIERWVRAQMDTVWQER